MSAGTISAMISSLKSNNRLRRKKKLGGIFYKKSSFSFDDLKPLSKEENLLIVEENARLFKQQLKRKRIFALILISFYAVLFFIALYILVL